MSQVDSAWDVHAFSATAGAPGTVPTGHRHAVRIRDPRVAEDLVGRAYLPIQVLPQAGRSDFRMGLTEVRMGRMTAGVLSLGTEARIVSAPAEQVHVNLTLRGRAVWHGNTADATATVRGTGVVFNPGQAADTSWYDDSDQLCLMIPRESLESEIVTLTGRPLPTRLVLAPCLAPGSTVSRLLSTALDLVAAELHDPQSTLRFSAVGRRLESLVTDSLLLGHQHNHSELLEGPAPAAGSRPIARAVELLEERPEHPWTTVSLAQEVHLSVRALQDGFRRHHDLTPMAYLRRTRLRRAHEELEAATPGSLQVQEVALRLGFLHLGRFAATYRDEYGVPPSATLARASA